MGFFDKLGAQLTNAGRTVSQNVKNASDSNSLNREINSHQKNIQQKYAEIGQLFYEKYSLAPESDFAEQMASIKNSMQEIVRLQAEIEEVKARKAELVPIPEDSPKTTTAPTAMVCTKCGNTYDASQIFCSVCGEKLVPQFPTPVQESTISQPAKPAETVIPEPAQPVENIIPEPAQPIENVIPEPAQPVDDVKIDLSMKEPLPQEDNFSLEEGVKVDFSKEDVQVRDIKLSPASKFCTVCGAENEGDSTFCVQCGSALD